MKEDKKDLVQVEDNANRKGCIIIVLSFVIWIVMNFIVFPVMLYLGWNYGLISANIVTTPITFKCAFMLWVFLFVVGRAFRTILPEIHDAD